MAKVDELSSIMALRSGPRRVRCGRLTAALIILSTMVGCASRPVSPVAGIDWEQRERQLLLLTDWQARGRIAVKAGSDGGQGNIQWRQAGAGAKISLRGPFGAGGYDIEWDENNIVVFSKAGEVALAYTGPDAADQFLAEQIGWSFPARSIRYWLVGTADPATKFVRSVDAAGWLATIAQNGWVVTYSGFTQVEEQWLPRKIVMENPEARIKLVVDGWTF